MLALNANFQIILPLQERDISSVILTRIWAYERLQKFCEREQASAHLIFASNSSKDQIFQALLNWMGPFDTP